MVKMEDGVSTKILKEECLNKEDIHNERSKSVVLKQQILVERQCRDIQVFLQQQRLDIVS